MDELLNTLPDLLSKTLSNDRNVRKSAEETILKLETTSQFYGYATLHLTQLDQISLEIKTLASIAFKNFVKRHWRFDPQDETRDQQVDVIDSAQRDNIKREVTKLMLNSSTLVQRQLSEAITIVAECDFPDKWDWLIIELKNSLESPYSNLDALSGVLYTAHSVFRRYRHELPSSRLWSEIKFVIEHFGHPFTERFKSLIEMTKDKTGDQQQLTKVCHSILLCVEIYRSLITQDLPEYFEDHLGEWLQSLLWLLEFNAELGESSASIIEDTKSEICEIASLFVNRYSDIENAKEFIQLFAQSIWKLLVTTNQDVKFDSIVSAAIRYLVAVASRPESRSLFQDVNTLNILCEQVIIPNLILRDLDEELFEDDPEEYVRRDIEGSDVDTRRRAACDLVQALGKFIEGQLVDTLNRFIGNMLNSYESNRQANWKQKDLAIFVYAAMSSKGTTRHQGTVSVSEFVNVEVFLKDNIAAELKSDTKDTGSYILKADGLRFITNFRNYLSFSTLVDHLPDIVRLVTSNNVVVRIYAAITLEKLLTMRDPNDSKTTAFKSEQFEPHLGNLVKTLLDALDMPGTSDNEYIMKAIMRLFSFSRSHSLVQFLGTVVPKMTEKLGIVARNPSKPYFNHYLFETLALLIRAACEQENESIRTEFEQVLFNIYEVVVAQDVQEFIPYVLQLLNLILYSQKESKISEKFKLFFQQILSPPLWERPANVKPLTGLLHTYVLKIPQDIVNEDKLLSVLGIFQKLLASKATDHEALDLLQTIMIHIPAQSLDQRINDVFVLLFQRLTGSKTVKLVKGILVCFSLYAFLRGADQLATCVNRLQSGIFFMVLEKLYIADVKKVTGHLERRICACGLIKILSHLPLIDNGSYNSLWAQLLLVLIELLEIPPESNLEEDEHFADITESLDFQAQYSRLNYASVKRNDPTTAVGDLKQALAVSLSNLSTKVPGFVPQMVGTLNQGVSACLMNYCSMANVQWPA